MNLFDPGPVDTRLRAQAMPGEDPRTLRRPADVAAGLVALCEPATAGTGEVVRFGG